MLKRDKPSCSAAAGCAVQSDHPTHQNRLVTTQIDYTTSSHGQRRTQTMSDKHVTLKRIAVFCGANAGNNPSYIQSAKDLGAELARRKIGLVYGGMSQYSPCLDLKSSGSIMNSFAGGSVGMMGAVAHAVYIPSFICLRSGLLYILRT